MDNQPHSSSKRTLPNTPRVSDKIMEYYDKFGHGRDLEKFMRLYSPANSQESQKTQDSTSGGTANLSCCTHAKNQKATTSNFSGDALELKPSRPLSVCGTGNSKSLPNMDVQGQNVCECGKYFPAKDVLVDITIKTDTDKEKILSASTENLQTPKKILKSIKTQTPESAAKSHRRLEWDSLGDIGYQKSMSTSNVSILEKSLLKAFFKESSVISEPVTSGQVQNAKTEQLNIVKEQKPNEVEHSTPPLACSTLVESKKEDDKPKQLSKSTSSTSLQEKFEKYAQTSLTKPPTVRSQEIQCSISASSSSIKEDTATPSSFEYYSSNSSKSKTSHSSDIIKQPTNPLEHPFITSITELLKKKNVLTEKNQQKEQQYNNIRDLQAKFKAALDENKENQSHLSSSVSTTAISSFSLTRQAPELDLGIQLICSLIDAKNVNCRQKKQLIRDIVKRITRLEVHDHTNHSTTTTQSSSGTTTQHSNDSKLFHFYDSVHSHIVNKQKANMSKAKAEAELATVVTTEEQVKVNKVQEKPTTTYNTNEKSKDLPVTEHLSDKTRKSKTQSKKSNSITHFPCKKYQQGENVLKENNTNGLRLSADTTCKSTQNPQVKPAKDIDTFNERVSPNRLETGISKKTSENQKNRSTQTNPFSKLHKKLSLTSTYPSSSSTSQDLPTQKFIGTTKSELNNSNTDTDQPTMREWLNPLTQSEIEYEEKKREEIIRKAAAVQKQKLLNKQNKHDCGRVQQLNWIESEIKRLECLKHLLLKDVTTEQSFTNLSSHEFASCSEQNFTKDSTQTDKLYDTVYSDKSSVLSESAERLVQEIEIILEESREDVVDLKESLKKSKDRKKEIQIVYEKEKSSQNNKGKILKPKFRTIKETISINEEQMLNDQNEEMESKQRRQREKIDTPCTEKSQESESLKDMVQQRKKDFMKAYNTKKQKHYEALKQQQKEDFKYLNIQLRKSNAKAAATTATAITGSDHYSVPHTMPRTFSANELSYAYTQHPLPLTPLDKELKTQNYNSKAHHIIYSTTTAQQPSAKSINNTVSTTTTTSSSSTSMLCISSDVSVPMGSCNTSTTPTTTHQYDDVAAAATITNIAVQTSDSIMCTKPIYGFKQKAALFMQNNKGSSPISNKSKTACIQVKPKGIAYVIEFEKDMKRSNSKLSFNTDKNTKSETKSYRSGNTEVTNNLKTFLSDTEPQLTLQEHLEKSKPKFLQHSEERKAILNQLKSMRQERYHKLREIIDNASSNSLEKRLKEYLPPPPIQEVRIFNTKEMKALTNKRFTNLTEVVAKQERAIEEKKRKSNRILRDIFSRRLQKRVLSGKLSQNHLKTVI